MAGGWGPPPIDFSPLSNLANTFFNARKEAREERYEQEATDLLTKMVMGGGNAASQGMSLSSLAPQAPQAPQSPKPVQFAETEEDVQRLEAGMMPGAPRAPTFAAMQGAQPSANMADMFSDKERQYALPTGYLSRTAYIESRFNPNADNPRSSAGGLFQFVDGTAKQYGLTNKYDPAASTDAAARLAADNSAHLSRVLGRQPTAGELYLAHQQGAGGAVKLLSNPNARAVDVVGADAVRLNGGDANMTAAQFASRWTSKVDGQADTPAPGAQNTQGFVIPGQGGGGGISQDQRAMIAALVRNPQTRSAGLQLWMQAQKGQDVKTVDLGNSIGIMDNQGNILRQIPKTKDQTPQLVGSDETGRAWVKPGEELPENLRQPRQPKDQYEPVKSKGGQVIGLYDKVNGRMLSPEEAQQRGVTPQQAQAEQPDFSDIAGIRKEVQALPAYKAYAAAIPAYTSMVDAAKRNDKMADLNLVYGLAKIMDPTSVVREGEMIMVNNAQGLDGQVLGLINSVNGGARLGDDVRAGLMREAQSRMNGFKQSFDADIGSYRSIAQRWRINEADIIPNVPGMPAFDPAQINSVAKGGQGAAPGLLSPQPMATQGGAPIPSGVYNFVPGQGLVPAR